MSALAGTLPTLAGALARVEGAFEEAPQPPAAAAAAAAAAATLEEIAAGVEPGEGWAAARRVADAATPQAAEALARGEGGGPWPLLAAAPPPPPPPAQQQQQLRGGAPLFVPRLGGSGPPLSVPSALCGGGGGGGAVPAAAAPSFCSLDASTFAQAWPPAGSLPPAAWGALHLRVAVGAYLRALREPSPPSERLGGARRARERAAKAIPDAAAHSAMFCALVARGRPLAAAQVLALLAREGGGGGGAALSGRGFEAAAALAGALGSGALVGALLRALPRKDSEGGSGRDALLRAAGERGLPPPLVEELEAAMGSSDGREASDDAAPSAAAEAEGPLGGGGGGGGGEVEEGARGV
jgi:hypothetical protein